MKDKDKLRKERSNGLNDTSDDRKKILRLRGKKRLSLDGEGEVEMTELRSRERR